MDTGRLRTAAVLITAAGLSVAAYGAIFFIIDLTSFVEIGLTAQLTGADPSLQQSDPVLYRFISHLQANLAGFIVAYGLALAALGWFAVRRGERWAVWTTLGTYLVGLVLALPIHYLYGLGTLGHVGPFYLVTIAVLAGVWLAWRAPAVNARARGTAV